MYEREVIKKSRVSESGKANFNKNFSVKNLWSSLNSIHIHTQSRNCDIQVDVPIFDALTQNYTHTTHTDNIHLKRERHIENRGFSTHTNVSDSSSPASSGSLGRIVQSKRKRHIIEFHIKRKIIGSKYSEKDLFLLNRLDW